MATSSPHTPSPEPWRRSMDSGLAVAFGPASAWRPAVAWRLAVAWLLAVTACSPDGPAAGSPATDSPGTGPWVVRNTPPFPVGELSPEPVVRIGALEGPTAVEFTELTYVASLRDGGIVAVDRGPNEIRWFDANGAFEYQAGGRGEGPGEFMYPVAATVLRGDTLVVYDGRTRRLTAFDPSGSLASTRQLEITSAFGVRLGTTGDGGLMAVEHRATFAMDGAEYNYARDTLVLMVPSLSAESVDTVARLPGPESVTWVDYVGGRPAATRQMELPLGQVALAAPTREGFAFVPPGEQGLSYRSFDGEAYGRGERTDLEPVEASPAIRAQYVARALAEVPRGGPPPGVIEEDMEARFALLGDDPTVPPWDRILVSGDGRSVWLRRYVLPAEEGSPSAWSVYGLDGAIQAELRVPATFRPTHIAGDRIAGIETDGLGVEYAVVYSWGIR